LSGCTPDLLRAVGHLVESAKRDTTGKHQGENNPLHQGNTAKPALGATEGVDGPIILQIPILTHHDYSHRFVADPER